jgi:hypothetical protein
MKLFLIAPALLLFVGCSEPPKSEQAAVAPPVVSIVVPEVTSLGPAGTTEKTPFNVQPDGVSAFSVMGKSFERGALITANGEKLPTVFGNPGWLTAKMPHALLEKPGAVAIKVTNPNGKESNSFDFKVTPKK